MDRLPVGWGRECVPFGALIPYRARRKARRRTIDEALFQALKGCLFGPSPLRACTELVQRRECRQAREKRRAIQESVPQVEVQYMILETDRSPVPDQRTNETSC